jgi:hypothetical protein
MPEPVIPCETEGNSTLCVERIQIAPPPSPKVELMPPVPPGEYVPETAQYANVAVEFVDFGATRSFRSHVSSTIGRAVEGAGSDFGVDEWALQLVRSGGTDVFSETLVHDVPDRNQLVVYLKCAWERFQNKLIIPLPTCEELSQKRYVVQIEIPAYRKVYTVEALGSESISGAVRRVPFQMDELNDVTYSGNSVNPNATIDSVHFRNGSAFVVYPEEPCPSQTPSPSNTPTPMPSFSTTPSVSTCASPSVSPLPHKRGHDDSFEVDDTDYSMFGKDRSDLEGGSTKDNVRPRTPMIRKARILVTFEDRTIPVLIKPIATGIDIFDAVERATGEVHKSLVATFMGRRINHYTKLKPFGFLDGDEVTVVDSREPAEDHDADDRQ